MWKYAKEGKTEQQVSNIFTCFNRNMCDADIPYCNIVGFGRHSSILHYSCDPNTYL